MRRRNRDLPILDELGAEFEALVGRTVDRGTERDDAPRAARGRGREEPAPSLDVERHATRRRAPARPSRAARERRSQASRVGRRTATVLLLVCLVGGVAFAALRGGDPTGRLQTAPVPLGHAGDGAWSFSAYRDGGQVCGVFVPRGGELGSRCAGPPRAGRIWARSAVAGGRRYVFGLAGRGVAEVEVSPARKGRGLAGPGSTAARVSPPFDRKATAKAAFPAGDRWFVVDLGPIDTATERAPIVVTPLGRAGRRVGPGYVDCSLGIVAEACRHRIEVAAAHH